MFQEEVNSLQIVAREVQKEMEEIVNFLRNYDIGKELQSALIEIEAENECFVDQKGEGDLGEIVEDEISAFAGFKIFDDRSETELEENEMEEQEMEEKTKGEIQPDTNFSWENGEQEIEVNVPPDFSVEFQVKQEFKEELSTLHDWKVFGRMLERERDKNTGEGCEAEKEYIEGVSLIEGLKVLGDEPKREWEKDFISPGQFLKTGSVEEFEKREVSSAHILLFDLVENGEKFHYFQIGLIGTENEFTDNLFNSYNKYKEILVSCGVYIRERLLEYKNSLKMSLQKSIICYSMKMDRRKKPRIQFDRGKNLNDGNKNVNFLTYLSYFRGFMITPRTTDCKALVFKSEDDSEIQSGSELGDLLRQDMRHEFIRSINADGLINDSQMAVKENILMQLANASQMIKLDIETHAALALMIDGNTVSYTFRDKLKHPFLYVVVDCASVTCCHVTHFSPKQKSHATIFFKEGTWRVTLAIGHGARDVGMIQEAYICGRIDGLEGTQAVLASDFAISQFRFLERLLYVHGHWCYKRIAQMICYIFYKNGFSGLTLFYFEAFTGFPGQSVYNDWRLLLVICYPCIVLGCWVESTFKFSDSKPSVIVSILKGIFFIFFGILLKSLSTYPESDDLKDIDEAASVADVSPTQLSKGMDFWSW